MTEKEINILRIEEDFKDTLENEIIKQNLNNKQIKIKDIKYIGEATWQDKINNKPLTEKVFFVDVEIKEIDEEGKERITEQEYCYLGNQRIGGTIGDNQIAFKESFQNAEPSKLNAVQDLIAKTSKEEIENNSLSNLRRKEMIEVLSAYLGRDVQEDEIENLLEQMNEDEIEELEEEQENRKDKDGNDLSEKQTDKIKVNGVQKADLTQKIDGTETLAKRLDLNEYQSLYVVYSDTVNQITAGSKVNNTTYSLVGVTKDGTARVLNDEFEMDKTVGNSGSAQQTKIRADSTATRDNKSISTYTRKGKETGISCENNGGKVRMFFVAQKTKEENEIVSSEIETSQTRVIPMQSKEILKRSKGTQQIDKVQNEIQEHTDKGCKPENVKDFDGDEKTSTHDHPEQIDENDYIPNTNMTWKEFCNKCGYRGEGALEKAIKEVNKLDEINQQSLENYIEEQEETFRVPEERNRQ